jgi:hypothetical protein
MKKTKEQKEPIKINLKTLIICIMLAILILIVVIALINKQKVEQYSLEKSIAIFDDVDDTEDYYKDYYKIINSYEEYIEIFENDIETLNLLKDVVDKDFFDTKSLIIVGDDSPTTHFEKDYISKIDIKNYTADITIKTNLGDSHTIMAENYGYVRKTFFLPIDDKNITDINIEYKNSSIQSKTSDALILIFMSILPYIALIIAIVKFIKAKKKITNEIADEYEQHNAIRKALTKSIALVIVAMILKNTYRLTRCF